MQRSNRPQVKIRCSKHMAQMIVKADRELEAEGIKQLALINLSGVIALTEDWGWNAEKIKQLFDKEEEILEECARDNNSSIISMFDEECDIELTNKDGVSYKDFGYLNIEKDKGTYTAPQWLQMRKHQKEWVGAMRTAALGLALHRMDGWDDEKIAKLLQQMQEIKELCSYDMKIMSEYAKEKINFDINDYKMAA